MKKLEKLYDFGLMKNCPKLITANNCDKKFSRFRNLIVTHDEKNTVIVLKKGFKIKTNLKNIIS
jgi:hypothetical protein